MSVHLEGVNNILMIRPRGWVNSAADEPSADRLAHRQFFPMPMNARVMFVTMAFSVLISPTQVANSSAFNPG